MKLITLNIWGGHVHDPLLKFMRSYQDIDIFCLQEVYHQAPKVISDEERTVYLNIFNEIAAQLPNHIGYFRPTVNNIYGNAIFIKKDIDVLGEGEVIIHHNPSYSGIGPTHSRNLQWLECRIDGQIYSIINVHGLWNGMGKKDSPERINQSKRIREFMDTINTPKILCGDFNLRPDTESLKIIEKDMNNLIDIHNIHSTRTSLYPKEEKFADYIFTSSQVHVRIFEVLPDEVSDHAPLLVEFN